MITTRKDPVSTLDWEVTLTAVSLLAASNASEHVQGRTYKSGVRYLPGGHKGGRPRSMGR